MDAEPHPRPGPFASRSLMEHLVRGAVGITAIVFAIRLATEAPWASLMLGLVMLLAFRGCPVCWTIGLVETASAAARRARASDRHP